MSAARQPHCGAGLCGVVCKTNLWISFRIPANLSLTCIASSAISPQECFNGKSTALGAFLASLKKVNPPIFPSRNPFPLIKTLMSKSLGQFQIMCPISHSESLLVLIPGPDQRSLCKDSGGVFNRCHANRL